jgi:Fe(3+) dicitrate transport protein
MELVGLSHDRSSLNVTGNFVGEMREQAGHGDAGFFTDLQAVIDVAGEMRLQERVYLTMRLENVTNARPIVAHRPFGARPYRPFLAQAGFRVEL